MTKSGVADQNPLEHRSFATNPSIDELTVGTVGIERYLCVKLVRELFALQTPYLAIHCIGDTLCNEAIGNLHLVRDHRPVGSCPASDNGEPFNLDDGRVSRLNTPRRVERQSSNDCAKGNALLASKLLHATKDPDQLAAIGLIQCFKAEEMAISIRAGGSITEEDEMAQQIKLARRRSDAVQIVHILMRMSGDRTRS